MLPFSAHLTAETGLDQCSRNTTYASRRGGIELSAWLFVPEGHKLPLPAITMAHGYAGTKYHGIEPIAEAFAEAGFVVLVHDHRGFGESGGEPRHDINPWQQITDWRRAISYLQDRPEVDDERVGLWGTSFAGGHALVLWCKPCRVLNDGQDNFPHRRATLKQPMGGLNLFQWKRLAD